MLVGEDGRRRQHRHLIAGVDRLERGAHRDLGLAEADVAAQQAVHRPRALEVLLDRLGGGELVVGLVELERRLELALEVGVGKQRRRLRELALGVELEQLLRHVAHAGAHAALGLAPARAAETVEARLDALDAAVALDLIDARQRQQQRLALEVGDLHHLDAAGGRGAGLDRRRRRRRRRRPTRRAAALRTAARAGRSPGRCRDRRAPRSRRPSGRAGR